MENNPKKSKAFIITFILILLLLLAGYYLYSNRAKIFDGKGTFSLAKIFSPLLTNSKNGGLKQTDNNGDNSGKNSSVVTTDTNGNKMVKAEAGEILKKGDVLYISGFNKDNNPIVMKAIANDKKKSLVFGVANQDMDKGVIGDILIEGILSGVNTKKTEITLWAPNNPLYLSDKIYGGMTKNTPKPPSYLVPVGSVIKVDITDGSIKIGGLDKNTNIKSVYLGSLKAFNSQLLGYSDSALRDYWNIVYGGGIDSTLSNNGGVNDIINTGWNNNGFTITPITIPTIDSNNYNPGSYSNLKPSNIDVIAPNSVKYGETAIISWTSTGATSCNVVGGNGTGTNGSFTTAKLTSDKAYTISCTGVDGTITKTVYIYVIDDGSSTTPIVTVTAKPAFITYGGTTTISWTSSRDISCTVNGGTAIKGKNGSFVTPALTDNTAYNVTCIDANGSATTTNVYVTVTTNPDGKCLNNGTNPPTCTTLDGACMNNATNPPTCTTTSNICLNGATNPPTCTTINDICLNGASNPPLCTTISDACLNGATNSPTCTTINGVCMNNATNPPLCTTNPNVCLNGSTNPPTCTTINGACMNNATNPPACTSLNNSCTNGATNPPLCTTSPTSCTNGATNPPACTTLPTTCTNGATNPPLCTTAPGVCQNGATNYPACNNICLNGETNPPMCTTINNICYNGATNYPACNNAPLVCFNGALNYPICDNYNNFGYPAVTVSASPSSVNSGDTSTISWTSINATSCNAGTDNGTGTSGSFTTGPITVGTSFAVNCTGDNGTVGNDVYVSISGANIFPTVSVTASPSSVNSGDTSTISWTSTNSTSCDAGTGNGTGTSGSFTTKVITANTSFAVTCSGLGGRVSNYTIVTLLNIGDDTKSDIITNTNQPQCSNGADDDGDGLIDEADPNCHMDGDLTKEYVSTNDSESNSPVTPFINKCVAIDFNPLTGYLTDANKAKLAELTRKFYLIAPTIKNENDITVAYNELDQYNNLSDHLDTLINECYDQGIDRNNVVNPGYTGPTIRFGNPWYKYKQRGSYITGVAIPPPGMTTPCPNMAVNPPLCTIPTPTPPPFDCKYVAGWFSGTGADGNDCNTYNYNANKTGMYDTTPASCKTPFSTVEIFSHNFIFGATTAQANAYQAGLRNKCKWNTGAFILDMEKILNVW